MKRLLISSAIASAFALVGCAQPSGDDEYVDRMAEEHQDDAPVSNEASQTAPASEVVSEEVTYATVDGTAVTGYLSRPAGAEGSIPGLLVIHEWWGLNDNIRSMTDRLAGEGYVALAVDLYGGQVAADPGGAQSLMQAAMQNVPAAEENLRQAFAFLEGEAQATRVGTIGWCFGGGWSLNTALLLPDQVGATVIYYGRVTDEQDRLATLEMPILGIFGGEDQGIPVDSVNAFEEALSSLGKNAQIHIYDGADHAFANPSGTNYQPEAAADAWEKTTAFFAEHLQS
jgi:carboxymethylenebutenolidase